MQLDLFQTLEAPASQSATDSALPDAAGPAELTLQRESDLPGDARGEDLPELSLSPPIPDSSCLLCQAQCLPAAAMLKHHPTLSIWRCQRDSHHRFWLSHETKPNGKRGKAIGVWLGHSRKDPGSGPGPIPDWANN